MSRALRENAAKKKRERQEESAAKRKAQEEKDESKRQFEQQQRVSMCELKRQCLLFICWTQGQRQLYSLMSHDCFVGISSRRAAAESHGVSREKTERG